MDQDPYFRNYSKWGKYLEMQINEVVRTAGRRGESRFYYVGMLQALVLERIYKDWKVSAFEKDTALEDLLFQAISNERL
jgi:hypothetical protein